MNIVGCMIPISVCYIFVNMAILPDEEIIITIDDRQEVRVWRRNRKMILTESNKSYVTATDLLYSTTSNSNDTTRECALKYETLKNLGGSVLQEERRSAMLDDFLRQHNRAADLIINQFIGTNERRVAARIDLPSVNGMNKYQSQFLSSILTSELIV